MALVFPRDLPSAARVQSCTFDMVRDMSINARRNGTVQIVERSDPRWSVTVNLASMSRADYQTVRAWWHSMAGGFRDFLMHDPAHPRPILYRTGFAGLTRHGGGDFDGTATVSGLTATTVSLSGLPSTFALKAGDYVGLVKDGLRALHMLIEDATASAGAVTVTVDPMVKTALFSGATANFDKPQARFMPIAGSDRFQFGAGLLPYSFSGIQRIV